MAPNQNELARLKAQLQQEEVAASALRQQMGVPPPSGFSCGAPAAAVIPVPVPVPPAEVPPPLQTPPTSWPIPNFSAGLPQSHGSPGLENGSLLGEGPNPEHGR